MIDNSQSLDSKYLKWSYHSLNKEWGCWRSVIVGTLFLKSGL